MVPHRRNPARTRPYAVAMRTRVLLVLVAAALSVLALRSVAGHDRLAGHTLISLTMDHGIDAGDLPVALVWVVGMVCLALLWPRRVTARSDARDDPRD
jgi:hypothetical protein